MPTVGDVIQFLIPCLDGVCHGPEAEGFDSPKPYDASEMGQDTAQRGWAIDHKVNSLSSFSDSSKFDVTWADIAALNTSKINTWAAEYYDVDVEMEPVDISNVSPWAAWAEEVMVALMEKDKGTSDPWKTSPVADDLNWRTPLVANKLIDDDEVPETKPAPSPSSILAAQLAKPLNETKPVPARQKDIAIRPPCGPTHFAPDAANDIKKTEEYLRELEAEASAEKAVNSAFGDMVASSKQQQEEAEDAEFIIASLTSPSSAANKNQVQCFQLIKDEEDQTDNTDDNNFKNGNAKDVGSCESNSEPVPEPMSLKELIALRAAEISGDGSGSTASLVKQCSGGRDRAETASTEATVSDGPGPFIVVEAVEQEQKAVIANSMPPASIDTNNEELEVGGGCADDWTVVHEDTPEHSEWTVLTSDTNDATA